MAIAAVCNITKWLNTFKMYSTTYNIWAIIHSENYFKKKLFVKINVQTKHKICFYIYLI